MHFPLTGPHWYSAGMKSPLIDRRSAVIHALRLWLQGILVLLLPIYAQAQIGMRELRLGSVLVTLVYPSDATARPLSRGPFSISVAPDAPATDQLHRLIVISHGGGGSAIADHDLAAALARAGFVVAQPQHKGDNYLDTSDAGPVSFQRRPREVIEVIDALGKDSYWSARLDLRKVGVHGMSAGGVTGLSLAGGQWRMLNLIRHCGEHPLEDEGFCFAGTKNNSQLRTARSAQFKSTKGVAEEHLPNELKVLHGGRTPNADQGDPRPDLRIASLTLAVPVAAIFSSDSLARVQIPVGVVSAHQDMVLLPVYHSDYVLKHVKNSTELMRLPAGHFDVLGPWPPSVADAVAGEQVRGGLPTPGFNPELRKTMQQYIVAFHRKNLLP